MIRIYLAAPYSHKDKKVVLDRVKRINQYAARLIETGKYVVFSPISHSHNIAVDGKLEGGFNFWERQDQEFIRWADIVFVLALDGWEESHGIDEEIKYAKALRKKIIFKDEDSIDIMFFPNV